MDVKTRSMVGLVAGLLLGSGLVVTPAAQAAPPWLPATPLFAAGAAPVSDTPVVAVAPDGTAVAAFRQQEGSILRVYASLRLPGGAFSTPVVLSDDTVSAAPPRVAIDGQGNATVAFQQGGAVRAAHRPANGSWLPTALVASDSVGALDLDAGANGGAALSWYASSPAGQRAMVAVQKPGSTAFGLAQPVSSTTDEGPSGIFNVRVAMDAAGAVAAIWTRDVLVSGTSRYLVETALKPSGTDAFSGTGELRSLATGSSSSFQSDVVMTDSGRTFAVWDWSDGVIQPRIEYSERAPGGTFGPRTILLPDPGVSASYPKPAINDAGTLALAWTGPSATVMTSVRPPGGAFTPARAVSGANVLTSTTAIAISPSEEAAVVWATGGAGDYSLYSARRLPGGEFGDAIEVVRGQSAAPVTTNTNPSLGLDDEGNGILVARRQSGSPATFSTLAYAYDVRAPSISGVSVPSSATAGTSSSFTATSTDRVGPVALTWDFGDGGTGSGAAVSHTYRSPGVYTATVSATDAGGNRSQASRLVQVTPATVAITAAKASRKGVLTLTVSTSGAGALSARAARPASGKGDSAVKALVFGSAKSEARGAGSTTLSIKPTRKATKALRAGKLKVQVVVTLTPAGGTSVSATRVVRIKRLQPPR